MQKNQSRSVPSAVVPCPQFDDFLIEYSVVLGGRVLYAPNSSTTMTPQPWGGNLVKRRRFDTSTVSQDFESLFSVSHRSRTYKQAALARKVSLPELTLRAAVHER